MSDDYIEVVVPDTLKKRLFLPSDTLNLLKVSLENDTIVPDGSTIGPYTEGTLVVVRCDNSRILSWQKWRRWKPALLQQI